MEQIKTVCNMTSLSEFDINNSNYNILHIKVFEYRELCCSSKNKFIFSCVLDNVISYKFFEYFFACNLIMWSSVLAFEILFNVFQCDSLKGLDI